MGDLGRFIEDLPSKSDKDIDDLQKKRGHLSTDKQQYLDYEVARRDRNRQYKAMQGVERRSWFSAGVALVSALIALLALIFNHC